MEIHVRRLVLRRMGFFHLIALRLGPGDREGGLAGRSSAGAAAVPILVRSLGARVAQGSAATHAPKLQEASRSFKQWKAFFERPPTSLPAPLLVCWKLQWERNLHVLPCVPLALQVEPGSSCSRAAHRSALQRRQKEGRQGRFAARWRRPSDSPRNRFIAFTLKGALPGLPARNWYGQTREWDYPHSTFVERSGLPQKVKPWTIL